MKTFNTWRKMHFLATDMLFALLGACLMALFAYFTDSGIYAYKYIEGHLLILYQTTATIAGALMGFSVAIMMLGLNVWKEAWFDLIKRDDKSTHEIWSTLKQTNWCLALLTATSLFVMATVGGNPPAKWTIIPYLVTSSVAVARLLRAVSIIHRMVDIAVQASRNN